MKIVLLGWNENTLACLQALIKAEMPPFVVGLPEAYNYELLLKTIKKERIKSIVINSKEQITAHTGKGDLLISASWPYLIKGSDLSAFCRGAINIHASMLPKYRGCHPLNWALLNDEKEIGVTVHIIDKGMDTGPILNQDKFKIDDNYTLISIRRKVHALGAKLLVQTIKMLLAGKISPKPQDHLPASLAPKRKPEDGRIDWQQPARRIFCLIRATAPPGPGAFSFLQNNKIVFWRAKLSRQRTVLGHPGEVIKVIGRQLLVKTGGDGVLKIWSYEGKNISKGQTFN